MMSWRREAIGERLVEVITGRRQIQIGYSAEESRVTLMTPKARRGRN
jgi:hypothetical protein